MQLSFSDINISQDQTHHVLKNKSLYLERFISVGKYHAPGFAPVVDKTGAYHIDVEGKPVYEDRYVRVFGFYQERAAVVDKSGCFHIIVDGEQLYSERYKWCGNFQDGASVVQDTKGHYFHIDSFGKPLYVDKYIYAGDFRDKIAVVQNDKGLYTHIYHDGIKVHDQWFCDLDVFHKGCARAKDKSGWCHIDVTGVPVYSERYSMVEPFYNGFARVEDTQGVLLIIDERGQIVKTLRDSLNKLKVLDKNPIKDEEYNARLELTRVAHLIYEKGYNVSIDGNLSYKLSDDTILISPSGAHKGFMKPEDFMIVDLDGNLIRGEGKPTSEYRLHSLIFKKRKDICCVIHAHSPYALAASLAGIDLQQTYMTVAPVPTTQYGRNASSQSAEVLDPYIMDYNWAIIPRHGVVVWADTIWNAFLRIEGLEHYAKVLMQAKAVNPVQPLPKEQRDELLKFWGLSL
jgi:ribulose-5-phosphate 4-epimerase/fuculose-1-phosphate aldolase